MRVLHHVQTAARQTGRVWALAYDIAGMPADRLAECRRDGRLWLPVVYPGFGWDNLKRQPPGTSTIPRRGGRFLWEQLHALARMKATSVYVAMFDEVDEGMAIFKVTSSPPTQARFVDYDGLPSDWYLRLVGEGARMLRGRRPITSEIPFVPHRVTPPAGTAAAPSAPRPAPRRVPPG